MLADGGLERAVDVGEPLPEDVAEADEDRQADAAQLQVIDQLLQVDPALGILRRVDADVAVRADGEVALAPALDLVELGGVGDRPRIALTPRPRYTARRAHAHIIEKSTVTWRRITHRCEDRAQRRAARDAALAVDAPAQVKTRRGDRPRATRRSHGSRVARSDPSPCHYRFVPGRLTPAGARPRSVSR